MLSYIITTFPCIDAIARAILIDLSPPLNSGSCHAVYESLSNTLTLINHLLGPTRLPLFSIIVLGNYPEVGKRNWKSLFHVHTLA